MLLSLFSIAIHLLDCAKESFFLKPLLGPCHCNTLALVASSSRHLLFFELKREENLLRPRVTYTLVVIFP
jgi:hypothetical protein